MAEAKIITVANQKGGAGKTTIAMQIAATAARRGLRTAVCDADPQGTALRWAAAAEEHRVFPADVFSLAAAGKQLHRELVRYVDRYDVIVVDCPPSVESVAARSALLVSNLVLVPVIPSPLDVWASVGIRELIDQCSINNEGLLARIVLNQVEPRTNLAKEVIEALDEFGIEILSSRLGHRTAYRASAAFGQSVHDFGSQATTAIEEVEALTAEALALIGLSTQASEACR